MDEGRQGFLHPDRRTPAADVARFGEQLLHVDHRRGFIAGDAGGHFQVHFHIPGHHADEQASAVSPQDQRLEYLPDRLSQLRRHVVRRQVVLIDFIGNEAERNPRGLQQPDGIGLLDVLFHRDNANVMIISHLDFGHIIIIFESCILNGECPSLLHIDS